MSPPRDVLFLCRTWTILKPGSKAQAHIFCALLHWEKSPGMNGLFCGHIFPLKFINFIVLIITEFSLGFFLGLSPCRDVVKYSLRWFHVAIRLFMGHFQTLLGYVESHW